MADVAPVTSFERALALDAADELAAFRTRFVIPDPNVVYLDGNSLGRLPVATRDRVARLFDDEWAGDLIRGWDRWVDLPGQIGDLLGAELLGAGAGQVVVCDSTSVNLYKLMMAALDAQPGRDVIVTDTGNFPTDRYIFEGIATQRGLTLRWVDTPPVEPLTVEHVAPHLDQRVAVVSFSHVSYTSAAINHVRAITPAAHDVGALVLWDDCHSVGSVPIDLDGWDVDLSVGCTYKYLNSGPGAPAWLYVRRSLQHRLRQPLWGWWSQRDQFGMGAPYDPQPDIRQFLVGTAPVAGLLAVEQGVRLLAEAGMARLRAKGQALTSYAVELHDAWLAPLGFSLASPRDPAARGSHVSLRHPDARSFTERLRAEGIVPDFRHPDLVRCGLAPLTTGFAEVWRAFHRLRELAS